MAHDGKGVAHVAGKTVFVHGALPGEQVRFRYRACHRRYDFGDVQAVLRAAPERVVPDCAHYGVCGGCDFQHLGGDAQIQAKQAILIESLNRLGKVQPEQVLEPLTGPGWSYRRKARLGVRYVAAKGRVLVGFRERGSSRIADLRHCVVLDPRVGTRLEELAALVGDLSIFTRIPQIEVAIGDEGAALVFRNLDQPTTEDCDRLRAFGQAAGLQMYLQPGGPELLVPLSTESPALSYSVPGCDVALTFRPTDFVQVNSVINRRMIEKTLELLDPQPHETVLDLFCGLGNFTLPLARRAHRVVGVEGDAALIERAWGNARANGLANVAFHVADLSADLGAAPWLDGPFDKLLLDPPRSGAEAVLAHIPPIGAGRIVYVSCNPATLARDAGELVRLHGYQLSAAGVMDMFPQTAHVESIALFERL